VAVAPACAAAPPVRNQFLVGPERETVMAVARVSKITASSEKSFQDATEEGLKRATKTLRGVTGFEVMSLKGKVDNGKITEYRVTLEVTFILE
jgi:flavin-binding protein dodecin